MPLRNFLEPEARMSPEQIQETDRRVRKALKLAPVHPGEILRADYMAEGMSINELSRAIRVPASRVNLIVNGKGAITADTAARLGRFFGTSAQYWLNIQNKYDLDSLNMERIERDVTPQTDGEIEAAT